MNLALLNSSAAASVGLGKTLFLALAMISAPFILFYLAACAVALIERNR